METNNKVLILTNVKVYSEYYFKHITFESNESTDFGIVGTVGTLIFVTGRPPNQQILATSQQTNKETELPDEELVVLRQKIVEKRRQLFELQEQHRRLTGKTYEG